MTNHNYQHWRLEVDSEQILWLYFDKQNSSMNTFDFVVLEELSTILEDVANNNNIKGLIILSGKETGFIAGADISMFDKFKNIDEAMEEPIIGQNVFFKLESLAIPTVALIKGFCLGGGLELALACRYRIVDNGKNTQLGLPEVKLGLHPGWGGCIRLPRLIGAPNALNLILSGRSVNGKEAYEMGLIDKVVPESELKTTAKQYVHMLPSPHRATWFQSLTNKKIGRVILGYINKKKLTNKLNPMHYPSAFRVLDHWVKYGIEKPLVFQNEAKSCGELFFNETSINLRRVFKLQHRLKSLSKKSVFQPKQLHLIGVGQAAEDIAILCALHGIYVTLHDIKSNQINSMIKRAKLSYKYKSKNAFVSQLKKNLLIGTTGDGIKNADIILEISCDNTYTNLPLKTIIAKAKFGSTSSATVLHFLPPLSQSLLVEIVKNNDTDQDSFDNVCAFLRIIGRLPLPVNNKPNYLVMRVMVAYLQETINMLNEGLPAEAIDKAMKDFGMSIGPIALAKSMGLDLNSYLEINVFSNNQGLHNRYSLNEISNRLVLTIVNESSKCLKDGVVEDADLVDAGIIFGLGFPDFTGGPLNYAQLIKS